MCFLLTDTQIQRKRCSVVCLLLLFLYLDFMSKQNYGVSCGDIQDADIVHLILLLTTTKFRKVSKLTFPT